MAMQIERIASHLRGATEVRRWLTANLPFTDTLAGQDLFLEIGRAVAAGTSIDLRAMSTELPHPEAAVHQELRKLMRAGLLVPEGPDPSSAQALVPTRQFLALLQAFADELDHVYALRSDLREQQLLLALPDARLRGLLETVYDHFHDLGWLYLHNFGAVCFLMSMLVAGAAQAHGHRARVVSGSLDVLGSDRKIYQLGGPVHVNAGQVAGHAWCVIDESVLVDFGVGGLRRGYRRDFPWGLACAWQPDAPVKGRMAVPGGDEAIWKTDWVFPGSEAEFNKLKPLAQQLAAHYARMFARRSAAPQAAFAADAGADSGFTPLAPPPAAAQTPLGQNPP